MTLQDITTSESGAITWADGTIWIGNWTSINGLPRSLGPLTIGLDLGLRRHGGCATPAATRRAMIDHCREQGDPHPPSRGYRSRRVSEGHDTVIVTTHSDWA